MGKYHTKDPLIVSYLKKGLVNTVVRYEMFVPKKSGNWDEPE